jgi:hypothetical protein
MTWTRKITSATTRSRWMKPPSVYEETSPSNQSTSRIIAIVISMALLLRDG